MYRGRRRLDWGRLLRPQRCAGCGRRAPDDGGAWCAGCRSRLASRTTPDAACRRCGVALPWPLGPVCPRCLEAAPVFSGAAGALPWGVAVAPLVRALKYGGRARYAIDLAALAALAWPAGAGTGWLATWVPAPLGRRLARGYDQAELLCRDLARRRGVPAMQCLVRNRRTRPQAGQTRAARLANLAGAFRVCCPAALAGTRVVLVDDVLSTGATAAACAAVLHDAGVRDVRIVTVARG